MKLSTAVLIALSCLLGLVVADYGYGGGYGGAAYVPVHPGGAAGGFGSGGLLYLIGLLFIIFFLFKPMNNSGNGIEVINVTSAI